MISKRISLQDIFVFDEDVSICLGFFDGVHIGHQALISKAKSLTKKVALLTLDESPKLMLDKNSHNYCLTSINDRVFFLEQLGVDYYLVLKFDDETKNLSPYDFIEKIIMKLKPKNIVVGFDYKFGKYAAGDTNTLKELSNGRFGVEVVEPILLNGSKVSTTTIISEITSGKIENVNEMLGRPYEIKAEVVKGLGNGKNFGFPTANLELINKYPLPQEGVYAVRVVSDKLDYLGMANIGTHPSVQPLKASIVEVNIFDFDGDIYGKTIYVEFLKFMRGEKKFKTIQELQNQLRKDKKKIIGEFQGVLKYDK